MNDISIETIKAVLFDMDGVLLDTMPFHAQAWQEAFASINLKITAEEVYAHEGESGIEAVTQFLKQRGIDPRPGMAKELLEKKQALLKNNTPARVFRGVPEFLNELKLRNLKLALVTGTDRHELEVILPEEIQGKFDAVVTGDEVAHGKPDPEPYLKALQKLDIRPEFGLVIENAPLGIKSARAAGLSCWAVETSLTCQHLQGAAKCFPNILALAEKLLNPPPSA